MVIDRYRQDLRARLAALVATGRLFVNMLVVDGAGRTVIGGSDDLERPPDLSDRFYFARHRGDRSPDLSISFAILPSARRVYRCGRFTTPGGVGR